MLQLHFNHKVNLWDIIDAVEELEHYQIVKRVKTYNEGVAEIFKLNNQCDGEYSYLFKEKV